MTLAQLSSTLRETRSKMPRRTSVQAYAQMDLLMGKTTSTSPKSSGLNFVHGRKKSA